MTGTDLCQKKKKIKALGFVFYSKPAKEIQNYWDHVIANEQNIKEKLF